MGKECQGKNQRFTHKDGLAPIFLLFGKFKLNNYNDASVYILIQIETQG